ncbi:SDR family oxidoreductase [Anabaena cylindrica FACHB-243]|uniref:NAD-dependent epimerase/dehydratase n=1 Tax=Anabaena cylindrica (strain ATCC 27899 / PCC 7122) TaxID=272123 RepID=K9ZFF4_ANACC|nr:MULTISPECIES: SDR family oxidoreductase [Anabaena]AFZ57474.1 NAD-dependent epimerase/dehydratase [Anabaena cylindrica PCC 7122]MBD2421157.1 SDR family oxidoreductase [Anabaena cylindrica FACHB-243]MBY5281136.1 SDR family oxidoreductase [Anabaena sp. CCAP 1446/1C]MBY5308546.1 SDR family oxidoreductase [Anabaena sp. CCAP 1446/1C]MCM2405912.1 SDR family oxidoreductase [Anabaena sp. CCAP 1446/1C]
MNIAIIGCGYVGYAVSQYWQENKNFIITATTTTPERVSDLKAVAQKVIVTQGNDLESLNSVLKNQDIVILSLGAKSGNTYEETYLQTAKTLVSVLRHSPNIRQLIYTGSYSVYGDRNGVWVDEETPPAPPNLNAQILRKTEDVLLSAENENLRVCILRLGGIYGPGRELVKIFGRVAGTNRSGNGEEITNWIHRDDIVGAIEFARNQRLQGIYNLVDDSHLTSRELIDNVLTKHNLPNVIWDATNKSNRPYNTWVSNQKIKDAGYKLIHPQITF